MWRVKCGYGPVSNWWRLLQCGWGRPLWESAIWADIKWSRGADLGRQKVTMLPSDGTASAGAVRWEQAWCSWTEKVSVGGTKWEQGRVWHDGETRRGQIMQGWWKAGFYSQWLTYRRILSRGEIRLLSSVREGVKVGSRQGGRKISFLQLPQRVGGLNAA